MTARMVNGRLDYFPDLGYRGDGDGWSDRASCRGTDPDVFFPLTAKGGKPKVDAIMRLCAGCPVGGDCLAWALRSEEFGWWAATSPAERVRLRLVLGINFAYVQREHGKSAG